MNWIALDPLVDLGFLPRLIGEDDPRPIREQIDDKYRYGGGWKPMRGWTFDKWTSTLKFPGDPVMRPLAAAQLRDEEIFLYRYSFLCVVQPNGSFEVSRVD